MKTGNRKYIITLNRFVLVSIMMVMMVMMVVMVVVVIVVVVVANINKFGLQIKMRFCHDVWPIFIAQAILAAVRAAAPGWLARVAPGSLARMSAVSRWRLSDTRRNFKLWRRLARCGRILSKI